MTGENSGGVSNFEKEQGWGLGKRSCIIKENALHRTSLNNRRPLLFLHATRFECSLRIISSPCSLAISNRCLSYIIIQSFEKTNLVPLQSCFDKVQSLFFSFRAAILILSFLPSFEIPSIHEYKYVFIFVHNGSTLV